MVTFHSAGFHKWAAIFWFVVGVVACAIYATTMFEFLIIFMSAYANASGHWSGYQAARAEEEAHHALQENSQGKEKR